jgi:FkbM family methyltransferase
MTPSSATAPRKQNPKPTDLVQRVGELVSVTNSIISNIQGQSDVNEALTKRVLALEGRLSQLETRMRAAPAAVPAPPPATPSGVPSNLAELVQRAAQKQNATQSIYIGDHLAIAQVLDRFKMFVDTRDIGISPHLLLGGQWELWITKLFCDLVRPGMTVVDVGANFGYYTLLAAAGTRTDAHVHAIEADPHNFELLEKNIELNGYEHIVKTYRRAALNTRREVTLRQFRNHFGSNGIFCNPEDPRLTGSVQVQAVPLDELIETPVDLVKIDAEGSEPLIFDGMREMIRRSPGIQILMEFSPEMIRATVDPREFLGHMRRAGLRVQGVSVESKLEAWPDERFLEPGIHTAHLSRA